MESSSNNKKWSGAVKDIGQTLKDLPEEFKGTIHISTTLAGKAYEADILVQNDFIIAVSFKEPAAKRIVYGEKAFDELMGTAKGSEGSFEANALTDNEFRLVVNANEGALLELIRDLVKTVHEISGEEAIAGMEGWEDLEDEWTDLEKQWKDLEEREKPYRDMIMCQELAPESIEQMTDAIILKDEVTAHKEPLMEGSFREEAREEPSEEISDEAILEEDDEPPERALVEPAPENEDASAPKEEILSIDDTLQDEIKQELAEISDEIILKDDVEKKEIVEAPKTAPAKSLSDDSLLKEAEDRILQEVERSRQAAKKPLEEVKAKELREDSREWMNKATSEIQKLKKSVDVYWGWDKKKKRFVGMDGAENPQAAARAQEDIPVPSFTEKCSMKEVKLEEKPEQKLLSTSPLQPENTPRQIPEFRKKIGFKDKLRYVTSKQTLLVMAAIDGKKSVEELAKETSTDMATMKTIIDQLVTDGYVEIKTL